MPTKRIKPVKMDAGPGKITKMRSVEAPSAGTNINAAGESKIGIAPTSSISSQDGIRLGFLIHDVSRMRRRAYDQFMKPLGVTRAQWWILANLSRHDGMMQTQLADVMEVGKASLGDVIESLERMGWVQRRTDPSDKRVRRVYLSKEAHKQIKRMTSMEDQFNEQILAELNSAELAELSLYLHKIKRGLSRFNPGLEASDDI